MSDEDAFLRAMQADPEDDQLRLVYADWLEERGDIRADFLRLHLAMKAVSPDHIDRVSGEHELSSLRKNIDDSWLAVVEPDRALSADNYGYASCLCFETGDGQRRWPEMEFHLETQDTECAGWRQLLDLVEKAARDGRTDFDPGKEIKPNDWRQVVTLPATIAKLKSVRRLRLYGSHLVRIPPEIGEMTDLEEFDPYTSYRLHWFPYEITRCWNLRDSRVSTRALYGNCKNRPPFPRLQPRMTTRQGRVEPDHLPLKQRKTDIRSCSVCGRPFEDHRLHRVWISLWVATDVLPLLVNACSEECIRKLPRAAKDYVKEPHRGGLDVQQPQFLNRPKRG